MAGNLVFISLNPYLASSVRRPGPLPPTWPPESGCAAGGQWIMADQSFLSRRKNLLRGQLVFRTQPHLWAPSDDLEAGKIVQSTLPALAWQTATHYLSGEIATYSGTTYVRLISHTSGTFATDLAAGKWTHHGNLTDWSTGVTYPSAICPGKCPILCLSRCPHGRHLRRRSGRGKMGAIDHRWHPFVDYAVGDLVYNANLLYICTIALVR